MIRSYTGNKDGVAGSVHPQLSALMQGVLKAFPALWDNGSFGVRNMRGKTSLSVHATGRAWDASYRFLSDSKKGLPKGGRKQAVEAMEWLRTHADALGVEMIIDYFPAPYGRAAKCDRDMKWQNYKTMTVFGAPSGDWFHVEVDGKKSSEQVKAVFVANPPKSIVVEA